MVIDGIARDPDPCFQAVGRCEGALHDAGLVTPTWREEMSESPPERVSQPEPNGPKFGWQHAANRTLEEQFHAVTADFGQSNFGQSVFVCCVVVRFGVG